jgi:hypothetical protein
MVREDMPWVELEPDEEFLQWIREFPQHTLPKMYELLDKYSAEKEIHIFRKGQGYRRKKKHRQQKR